MYVYHFKQRTTATTTTTIVVARRAAPTLFVRKIAPGSIEIIVVWRKNEITCNKMMFEMPAPCVGYTNEISPTMGTSVTKMYPK